MQNVRGKPLIGLSEGTGNLDAYLFKSLSLFNILSGFQILGYLLGLT